MYQSVCQDRGIVGGGVGDCVFVCVCVCMGISKGSVWLGNVSTINPASYLQATAFLTQSHNPTGTSAS